MRVGSEGESFFPGFERCCLALGKRAIQHANQITWLAAAKRESRMRVNDTTNFKATALSEQTLRSQAPSIFASGPMQGVSSRYTFVPTARIVDGLREQDWVPVEVEEQRI